MRLSPDQQQEDRAEEKQEACEPCGHTDFVPTSSAATDDRPAALVATCITTLTKERTSATPARTGAMGPARSTISSICDAALVSLMHRA
jgi:hypothetical protein